MRVNISKEKNEINLQKASLLIRGIHKCQHAET